MSLRAIKLRSPYAASRPITSPGYVSSPAPDERAAAPAAPRPASRSSHPAFRAARGRARPPGRLPGRRDRGHAARAARWSGRRRPPRPRSRPRASRGTGPRRPRGADRRGSRRRYGAATPQEIRSPPAARRLWTASVATARASSTVADGSSTQNSSPPKRPTTASACRRAAYTSASAAAHSARSPASCPPCVVHPLQVVDVAQDERGRARPGWTGARLLERQLDGAAACHAGERVGVGQLLDLGEQLGAVDRAHELVGDRAQEARVVLRQARLTMCCEHLELAPGLALEDHRDREARLLAELGEQLAERL